MKTVNKKSLAPLLKQITVYFSNGKKVKIEVHFFQFRSIATLNYWLRYHSNISEVLFLKKAKNVKFWYLDNETSLSIFVEQFFSSLVMTYPWFLFVPVFAEHPGVTKAGTKFLCTKSALQHVIRNDMFLRCNYLFENMNELTSVFFR